jgi:hypothetical protein
MGFIIRSAFWLSLVLLLIPVDGTGSADQPSVNPISALLAARDAVADVSGMCERRPEVCVTGRAALDTIQYRAVESARFAYDLIERPEGEEAQAAAPADATITTGTVAR